MARILGKAPSEIVYLAGAGISMPAPSGLPGAVAFISALVHTITSDPRLQTAILGRTFTSKSDKRFAGDFLRFEALVGGIRLVLDEEVKLLRVYSNCTAPNAFHFYLAGQLQGGAIVMTTNFDNLIEVACRKLGIDYSLVVSDEELAAFAADSTAFRNPLIKLHGGYDLVDSMGPRKRGPVNLKTTLEQVGKVYLSGGTNEVTSVMADVIQRRHLVVMGYSGCDDFDIMPCLLKIRPEKGLTWLAHAEQAIQTIRQPSPEMRDLPPYQLLAAHAGGQSDVTIIQGITVAVLGIDINCASTEAPYEWNRVFSAWSEEHLGSEDQRRLLLGQILSQIGPLEESIRVLEGISPGALTVRQRVTLCFLLSNLYVYLGDNKRAIMHLSEMADFNERFAGLSVKGFAYYSLARVNTNMGLLPEAEMYLNAAMRIFEQEHDVIRQADCIHELGRICLERGDQTKAIHNIQLSNELSNITGHVGGSAIGYMEIARALTAQGKLDEAQTTAQKAISMFELNGDQGGLGSAHHMLGYLLSQREDYVSAAHEFEQALKYETSAGAKLDLGHSLHALGDVYGMLGKFEKAKECLQESLKIKREIGDRKGIANSELTLRAIELRQKMGF